MSLIKVVLLISYSSMKNKLEWFGWFLTLKVRILRSSRTDFKSGVDLPKTFYSGKVLHICHSIKLGFEGQVAKKFLNGIYLLLLNHGIIWKIKIFWLCSYVIMWVQTFKYHLHHILAPLNYSLWEINITQKMQPVTAVCNLDSIYLFFCNVLCS